MKLTFCWAAQIVTGSCYLIETWNTKFLIDCGMFQWPREIMMKNYEPFLFDPKEIDFMLLTHAHIDHCGLIPKLHREGFEWKIYTTSATRDLCEILFQDSAEIQQKNTEQQNRRRLRRWLKPRKPLYTIEDGKKAMKLFNNIEYTKTHTLDKNIQFRFQEAGHILWSSCIELFVTEWDKKTKLVFSWDVGQRDTPIIEDPTLIQDTDYLFMESTYGDRIHEDSDSKKELLTKYINETYNKWGRLLIPSFSVERTQELLYFMNIIIKEWKFPREKIFLDSPLSIEATEVFKKHTEYFDEEATNKYPHPFTFNELEYTKSVEESQKLNNYNHPCIIIAGNGMCTAWRITHHLKHGLWNSKNTLLFVWYQAEGTLGREILEWKEKVWIMWEEINVNASMYKIDGFSWHADANQLMKRAGWFTTPPKKTFIMHGEVTAQTALKERLEETWFECEIPSIGQSVEL